jgi:hypothetical protein
VKNEVQGYRRDHDGLLRETKEQLATALWSSPVESEGELVQVVIQVIGSDGSLMSAQEPAFEQRRD